MAYAIGLDMIKIKLNGKEYDCKCGNISELIKEMELPKFFVVEKNGEVIYKEKYEQTALQKGDVIEIAGFCGGG